MSYLVQVQNVRMGPTTYNYSSGASPELSGTLHELSECEHPQISMLQVTGFSREDKGSYPVLGNRRSQGGACVSPGLQY